MKKLTKRWSTFSSGGSLAVGYELMAGSLALLMAVVASATGQDISVWHCAVAGLAGIAGSWIFTNPDTSTVRQRLIAVLSGGALASLFGPLLANASGFYWAWVGSVNYYVTAAAGLLVGLVCTPILRLAHNPGPAMTFIVMNFFSWIPKGKKDDKDA